MCCEDERSLHEVDTSQVESMGTFDKEKVIPCTDVQAITLISKLTCQKVLKFCITR